MRGKVCVVYSSLAEGSEYISLVQPWILDGFPRTLGQGELLDTHIMKVGSPLSLVIYLDVADDILRSRITGNVAAPLFPRISETHAARAQIAGFTRRLAVFITHLITHLRLKERMISRASPYRRGPMTTR
jgi:adenylate kinase family enzyme